MAAPTTQLTLMRDSSKHSLQLQTQAQNRSIECCTDQILTLEAHLQPSRTKNYTLNKSRCLHLKRKNCDRPFMNILPKDNGRQLNIECSTGCFELLKSELVHLSCDNEIGNKFGMVFTVETVTDHRGNSPETIIKATNRLASGAPGKRTKFTIDMYNTQCSLLINGNNTPG